MAVFPLFGKQGYYAKKEKIPKILRFSGFFMSNLLFYLNLSAKHFGK